MKIKDIALFIVLVLLAFQATASEVKVVVADGEALLGEDTTPAQARAMARNNARRNALEQAVGVQVRGSTVLYNSDLVSDLVVTATKGLIVREEVLEDQSRLNGNQVYYHYRLQAHVKPINTEKRGNFRILDGDVFRVDRKGGAKSPVFQDGDEIQVSAKVNEDCFIHIFSVGQDGRIIRLFPHEYFKGELVKEGQIFIFPEEKQRMLGVAFRVRAPKNLNKAVESVLIIATKIKEDFLSGEKIENPTITDLMAELAEIDPSLWTEKTIGYEVRK